VSHLVAGGGVDGSGAVPGGEAAAGVRWAKIIARRVITNAYAIADKDERRRAVSLARRGESAAPD
jgi:hypothetical protein